MRWRHRCDVTAHFIEVHWLAERLACIASSQHRRVIGWRVCLRQLVLVVEVVQHRGVVHALHLLRVHTLLTVTERRDYSTVIRCIRSQVAIKFLLKNWLRTYFLAVFDVA